MVFKIKKKDTLIFESPQEMYRDYKRRTIKGPLDYQSKMIDLYMNTAYEKKDIAFELPTGSGKTLIGLLIGEYRRRKNKEKVVYICPTNQLVNQVVEKANSVYGFKVHGFTGSRAEYDQKAVSSYTRAEGIAITNYSSLFNTNSFFNDADVIIFDDAHSSENYIASNWSLKISFFESRELFLSLAEVLKDTLETTQYNRLVNENSSEANWYDKLPNLKMAEKIEELMPLIESHVKGTKLKHPWNNIKNHLHACNMFFSNTEILIRPYIPPTMTHEPFANAKQRIYMSATLGESGELERITGVRNIHRLPIADEWGVKSIGRRFFVFPNASFKVNQSVEILLSIKKLQKRALILVQDERRVQAVEKVIKENSKSEIYLSKDIEKTKEDFTNSEDGIAILANRYDGIDLDGEKCNLLMLLSLPNATHLQEKFITNRMAASVLFNERIKTRIVQAIGRCTRSDVDYAAVIIFGTDLENALISPKKITQFQPEMRAELEFGYDQSENHDNIDDLLDNLKLFFERGEKWESAEEAIINLRDDIIESDGKHEADTNNFQNLKAAAMHEVDFQYALWKEDYEDAMNSIDQLLRYLNGQELTGYRGFWYYIAGYVAFHMYKSGTNGYYQVSKDFYKAASQCTSTINWFNKLVDQKEIIGANSVEEGAIDVLERIELQILKDGVKNPHKFETRVEGILQKLRSNDGNEFESGHMELGNLIGYISDNGKGDSDPDPWWIINDKFCIVSEDKIYKKEEKGIPTKHIKQAQGHEDWIRAKVDILRKDALIQTIILTNSNRIESSAIPFANKIYHVNRDEFVGWAIKAIEALRKMRRSFRQEGDIIWRLEAEKILKEHQASPSDFIEFIQKKKLVELPVTNK
ncbi:DEAD/DEAH box helicase family protein [Peribacillus sp. R9-11]|uniref:DEAD/DEAH box helicase family protein n=1 Tax=Peribacillus sp. R9-11 TaxID=3073271 RepID=UPI0028694F0C|nr:DEAD/DEAH box helicase family protein [Peribacillus sp. R9-11]WMX58963.1 DEAD/DEAH box helicase family protein [Peribacillus sp. R9-11]